MVPKVAAKGASFKGAGLYYLHDKKAATAERVAFTHTENLPTDQAELALRYMAYTAMRQDQLKAAAGVAMTGRKLTQTVYAYSLSWAPDEAPEREEMIEAARETLKALGLDSHETLMVSHNDEPHPHIHVIVNRVHPETGLAAKVACDHLVLSRWAEEYERQQGQIRCDERVENNKRRRELKARNDNGFVKHKKSRDKAAHHRARKDQLKAAFARRDIEGKNLSAHHKGQRAWLYDEKERHVAQQRLDIRAANKPKWAALYKRQKQEQKQLREAQRTAFSRLRYFVKTRPKSERGFVAGAIRSLFGRSQFDKQLAARQESERKALAARITQQTRQAVAHESKHYRAELDTLKQLQSGDTAALRDAHTQESKELARQLKEEADADRFEKEVEKELPPKAKEEFRKRVGDTIRKAKKRDERGKGNGRERE
ncbi:MAG: relaxase/mobilization nuclease domain-containing protein [Hyphomicrobiales bacterium]|nr:relaxase/mobilization nuclease domain-containing protein [Hyphomicrobiales bacterium]